LPTSTLLAKMAEALDVDIWEIKAEIFQILVKLRGKIRQIFK
jgi:hypothetical protein